MRVLVVAVGSRGDVAPYTGLGAGLVAAGHDVTIAAHPPFEQDIRRAGSGFAALGGDVRGLVTAPANGRPSPMLLARRVDRFTEYLRAAATDAMASASRGTDVVLYNSSAFSARTSRTACGCPVSACSRSRSNRRVTSHRSWRAGPTAPRWCCTVTARRCSPADRLAGRSGRDRLLVAAPGSHVVTATRSGGLRRRTGSGVSGVRQHGRRSGWLARGPGAGGGPAGRCPRRRADRVGRCGPRR